ncbi:MAG TPA: hypothetical protein VGD98_18425 [Ktedonobacteraceae bacterium]
MSIELPVTDEVTPDAPSGPTGPRKTFWRQLLFSPLWLCLLLALAVRIWLIVRTQGFIEGDEVLTGIQAQQILHGARPIYFYGQPYMGSLEAYLIAALFTLFGSSVWVLRAEPILLSLLLVGLTWKFALVLADEVKLSPRLKLLFATLATLIATVPPLYDIIPELHTWGGYIETFVCVLLVLICTLRLTRRWQEGASQQELALRWAGLGFVIGLAFWIYPLILPTVATAACWVLICCAGLVFHHYRQLPAALRYSSPQAILSPLAKLWLVICALPAALLGFTPGLIWGSENNWANITYIANAGGGIFQRLDTVKKVARVYLNCVVPHVVGGAVPLGEKSATLHMALFWVGLGCLGLTAILFLAALAWSQSLAAQFARLTLVAVLLSVWTSLSFIASKNSIQAIVPCALDHSGRYAVPMELVLPFIYAALVICAIQLVRTYLARTGTPTHEGQQARAGSRYRLAFALQAILLFLPLGYVGAHTWTYQQANVPLVFESPYCHFAPIDDTPIVNYLESQHVEYAWSTNWIAYRIVFETQSRIIVSDVMAVTPPYTDVDRIPANTQAVSHAERPALLLFVPDQESRPAILSQLDAMGVQYRFARFTGMLGKDVLVIIPLNRTVSPLDSPSIASNFTHCDI